MEGIGRGPKSKVDKRTVEMFAERNFGLPLKYEGYKTKQRLSRYRVQLLKRCQIIVPQLDTLTVEARGVRKVPNPADFGVFVLCCWHR